MEIPQSQYAPMGPFGLTSKERREYAIKKRREERDLQEKALEKVSQLLKSKDGFVTLLNMQSRFLEETSRNCMLIYLQKPKATLVKTVKEWEDLGGEVYFHDTHGKPNAIQLFRRVETDETSHVKLVNVYDVTAVRGVPNQAKSGADESERALQEDAKKALDGLSEIYIDVVEDKVFPGRVHYDNDDVVITVGPVPAGCAEKHFHAVIRNVAAAWISWQMAKVVRDDGSGLRYISSEQEAEALLAEYMVCSHLGLNVNNIRIGKAYQTLKDCDVDAFMERLHYAKRATQKIVRSIEEGKDGKE